MKNLLYDDPYAVSKVIQCVDNTYQNMLVCNPDHFRLWMKLYTDPIKKIL